MNCSIANIEQICEVNQSYEANASIDRENEISKWAERVLHLRSPKEVAEEESDVC